MGHLLSPELCTLLGQFCGLLLCHLPPSLWLIILSQFCGLLFWALAPWSFPWLITLESPYLFISVACYTGFSVACYTEFPLVDSVVYY